MKNFYNIISILFFSSFLTACQLFTTVNPEKGLVGYWPLSGNLMDISGNEHHAIINGITEFINDGPNGRNAIRFNGYTSWLKIETGKSPLIGNDEYSISVWIKCDSESGDIPGDILSQYDSIDKKGFNLSLKSSAVTTSLANDRQLHFGIDNDQETKWIDCGRPGNAICAFSMASYNGTLYAGTCESGKDEFGHVYSYAGENQWIDCGSPDSSNGVMALAVYNGKLYAGTGKYRLAGSSLPESENPHLGGNIFRFEGDKKWVDCGKLPSTEVIGGLIVYKGDLYATSMYRPAGFFRYDSDKKWSDCGTPEGKRVEAMCVYNGYIYATSWDGGYVYRYDGKSWANCGLLGNNTQTYSFAVHYGRLYVGTWPSGRVYRFEEIDRWTDMGRLGKELEVMGMLVHNGRLIAGTLPLAEIYSFEGDTVWKQITRIDYTPEVRYHRAWTMAENDGKVFCSTLPSGKIYSFEAGCNITSPDNLNDDWHHIVAIKSNDHLLLYTDGKHSGNSRLFDASEFEFDSNAPLRIGFGPNDYFNGQMADLRIYNRALNTFEIKYLSDPENFSGK